MDELAHALDRAFLQLGRGCPGEDRDLGVRRQRGDIDRGLVRVGRAVVRQHEDRRAAVADRVARDAVLGQLLQYSKTAHFIFILMISRDFLFRIPTNQISYFVNVKKPYVQHDSSMFAQFYMSVTLSTKKEKHSEVISRDKVSFSYSVRYSFKLMSQKKIDDECEGRILALLQLNHSPQRQIVNILKDDGINVSQRTVSNVKKKDRSPTKFRRKN